MTKQSDKWRNRIIGTAEVAPDSLLAHPSNWRGHPANQQNALADILGGDDGVGWLDTVMVNKRTSELWPEGDRNVETVIDGHLRIMLAMRHHQPTVPVRYVDLTPAEEALALATFDPIGALAQANAEQLDAVLREVQTGSAAVGEMLAGLAEKAGLYGEDTAYSRKIESPIYEPSGAKPSIAELFDDAKTQELVCDILAAEGLTEDERRFLTIAAQRHTVLYFDKIADYYAHSERPVQSLMENNALVIIDFNKAIEQGYVQLTKNMADLVRDEYGE